MKGLVPYTINAGGTLIDLSEPQVMGILNVTPDSFYSSSRMFDEEAIACRTRQILDEGGTIIDVGAYSTRPGSDDVSEDEEARRLHMALATVRKIAPEAIVSIDTFRASIARMCVEEFGANIINDVSGGDADNDMFSTVAALYTNAHRRNDKRHARRRTSYVAFATMRGIHVGRYGLSYRTPQPSGQPGGKGRNNRPGIRFRKIHGAKL